MMDLANDIKLYLPQYLSDSEKDRLKEELKQFPLDGTKGSVYTTALNGASFLLQGDGIALVDYVSFPSIKVGKVKAILFSNTCDMSTENHRMYESRILYAPILNMQKFIENLRKEFPDDNRKIDDLTVAIKKQHISQILYLPQGGALDHEGIVFFDRAISIPLNPELVKEMCNNKIFTLSNFGFYLFLFKLSVHFTRIQEKVDRSTGQDLGTPKQVK